MVRGAISGHDDASREPSWHPTYVTLRNDFLTHRPSYDDIPAPLRALLLAAALIVCTGAVLGQPVLTLAGVGLALALIAGLRFEALVLASLFVRAALDASKSHSPLGPATVLGALFLTTWAVRELLATAQRQPPLRGPFTVPLITLLGLSIVSGLLSDAPRGSLIESLRLGGVVAMVIALERLLHKPQVSRRVLIAVFASAVLPMAFGLLQMAGHDGGGRRIGDYSRVTGTFLHPNPFSIYLAVLICTAVALLPHISGRPRWALAGGLAVGGVLLLGTYTRGSWIALVVGLLVVGAIQSRWLVGAVIGGVIAVMILVPSVSARFSDLETTTRYSGTAGNSLVWRVEYWNEALQLNHDSPLLGIGLKGIERSTTDAKNVHNDVVRVFVELGIAGLAVYLWLAAALMATARRALRATSGRNLDRGIAVGFAGSLAIVGLVSLSSNVITQVVLLWYVGTLAILAAFAGRSLPAPVATAAARAYEPVPPMGPGVSEAVAPLTPTQSPEVSPPTRPIPRIMRVNRINSE